MRLLRYSGALLLVSLAGCPSDDSGPSVEGSSGVAATSSSSGPGNADTTTDDPPPMTTTTTDPPATDSTGGSDSGGSSSDDNGMGQACRNGIIEGTEQCDCGADDKGNPLPCSPAGLGGQQCAGLTNPAFPDRVYTGGILDCSPASCQFTFNTCTFCGDTVLNGNEICELDDDPGPSCQALGRGSSTNPLPCGPTCNWYVECCDPETAPKDCP